MNLDSKYFDRIRVRSQKKAAEPPEAPCCAWDGCKEPGVHRAPRGRDHEGEYLNFCVEHVRQYNKSYNYFSGLDDNDIRAYLKDSITGHRPTWTLGSNSSGGGAKRQAASTRARRWDGRVRDEFGLFGDQNHRPPEARRRRLRSLETKALKDMGLGEDATGEAIRTRYKALVKQYHPDANGGDRGNEDRLREVIQAYKLLKQSNLC